ncbi:MAG: hypothetical protein NVS1B5_14410 [Gemmatimonadaceae bacterium]
MAVALPTLNSPTAMIRSRFVRSFSLLLATFVAFSCSDYSATGPLAPTQAQSGLLGGLLGTATGLLGTVLRIIPFVSNPNGIPVTAVKWAPTHVNQVQTVSATIGYDGGTLAIPGSDFTIFFPQGALPGPTAISITSDASGYVSYDMQPHGITFAKPVIVTQRLNNTAVYGTSLALNSFCAYFPQDLLDLSGILQALEIETTTIFSGWNGQAELETWQLNHFSRYMLASG